MRNALLVVPALLATVAAATVRAQDPATACAEALLRGDAKAAADHAAAATAVATRARLQAALLPLERRPAAMLAVARAFMPDPEADHAVLAGAAAVLAVQERRNAVHGLIAWCELVTDDLRYANDTSTLASTVLGLRSVVAERRSRGGDQAALDEAERLLSKAIVSRFGLWPARLPVGAAWLRPDDLADDLELRLRPCAPGSVAWDDVDFGAAPIWRAVMPRSGPFELPPLTAGDWLLEARSSSGPWLGLRHVEVSDLETIALATDEHLVMAAFDQSGPTAVNWQFRTDDALMAQGSFGPAAVIVPWPGGKVAKRGSHELVCEHNAGRAWLGVHESEPYRCEPARWLVHGMVDRPLYRPGESVSGRIVLRSCQWRGERLSAVPTTAVAAEQPLRVVVEFGGSGRVELPGRTDAHGVFPFSFAVPAEVQPDAWFRFVVELPAGTPDGESQTVDAGYLCGTAFFRRQSVRLRVEGPATVPAGTASAAITAITEWASGGPAAGIAVRANVTVRQHGERKETHELRTDAEGRATVRIPIAAQGTEYVWINFAATGPDGHVAEDRYRAEVVAPSKQARPAEPDPWNRNPLRIELGSAVVGANVRVTLRGTPNDHGVLVTGRGRHARAQAIRFDGEGRTAVDVPVVRADWPRLDVTVAVREHSNKRNCPVALRASRPPTIELPPLAQPGSDVTVRIATDAPATVVTVAVVDERIYELQPDCTEDPSATLRPEMPWWSWASHWAPPRIGTDGVLGKLLLGGRIPPLDGWLQDVTRPRIPAAGSAHPGRHPPGGLRADFRATAAFATVIADQNGVATLDFKLPADLTRWRVTAAGVDREGTGFLVTNTLASRQPLAAEPQLPRGVRAGDTFELPILIDRNADAVADADTVEVTAQVDGDALQITAPPAGVDVRSGRAARTATGLRANAEGTARLSLTATLGEHIDRSRHELHIGPDAVLRPLVAAAMGEGEVNVAMPEGSTPEHGLTVEVMLGGAAAWRQLESALSQYPHGCVEQTVSRLVPYFAAARAAHRRGQPLPAMDQEFRRRLFGGLGRLRALGRWQGGFAFWPGGEVDAGMTALALHGLAVLREGGFDPAQADLHVDTDAQSFDRASERLHERETVVDASFLTAAELVVAAHRFQPDDDAAAAIGLLLKRLPELPAGLCARLGLACLTRGNLDGARACRDRVASIKPSALLPDGFPGEDPLAVQALELELAAGLGADPARLAPRAADLLLACLRGHGSTYAHACALSVLALVLPPTPDVETAVEITVGNEVRSCRLGGKYEPTAHWRVPHAAPVRVKAPAGVPLLVRVATERSEPAAGHAAWQSPLLVERDLCSSRRDATWREREDGTDLAVLQGPPAAGQPLVLRVRVQSPVPMRFVVVECPLPAGFELAGKNDGVDRYDDRLVFTCDLAAGEPCVRRIAVVPMVPGRLLWPPTTAAPMYVSGLEGGSAGTWLEVVPTRYDDALSAADCFSTPVPEPPPDPTDPIYDYFEAIRVAWSREPVDEDASRREIEALLAAPPAARAAEPWTWLEELRACVNALDVPEAVPPQPAAEWRFVAFATLRAMQRAATQVALTQPLPPDREAAAERLATLAAAVATWTNDPARERALALLLARARLVDPERVTALLDDIEPPASDPELIAELHHALAGPDRDQGRLAFASLPPEEQDTVPPAWVVAIHRDELPVELARRLLAHPAGRSELIARLRDVDFVLQNRTMLTEALPLDLWHNGSLDVLRSLAIDDVAQEGADVLAQPWPLAQCVAAGPIATEDLHRTMATADAPAWRALLACALRARGGTSAPTAPAADPAWPLWSRALALRRDDAQGALALLDELAPRRAVKQISNELDLLAAFAITPVVTAGTPEQVYAARAAMSEAAWQSAWRRFDTAARLDLLARFRLRISDEFVPACHAEAEAIWQFVQRGGEVASAADPLTHSVAGLLWLRDRLQDGRLGEHAPLLREAYAERLGLAATTLQPERGQQWHSLVLRLQQFGFDHDWSAAERQQLVKLAAWCGLSPAAVR